jgi:hypothetical protein
MITVMPARALKAAIVCEDEWPAICYTRGVNCKSAAECECVCVCCMGNFSCVMECGDVLDGVG